MYMFAILVHAASGGAAFLLGLVLLFQTDIHRKRSAGSVFFLFLLLLEIFLLLALISHWQSLSILTQLIFGGLAILGLYMVWRALQAVRLLTKRNQKDQLKVIDHIGFNLISLFDGFAIISALDLQAPGWVVAVVALAAGVAGIYSINLRKKRFIKNSL